MSRTVYVNGQYLPETEATLSIFDRGILFADAVYEVTAVLDGGLVDFDAHMRRLARSLGELDIPAPCSDETLLEIHRELLRRNGLREGLIYLQVSRGAAERDFLMPDEPTPSLVLFTQEKALLESPTAKRGIRVITVPDQRWRRCDIKTTQLLYPSMAKTEAVRHGADDAWMVHEGTVTEGTSNNAYIVEPDGTVVTRQLSEAILHGITRSAVLAYAREAGVPIRERAFTVAEAKQAAEAFITSATSLVTPVINIDGHDIGGGTPGPVVRRIRELYIEESRRRLLAADHRSR
ncbi:D-amino-acid transaminase [Sediminicurvatus halobius]|uniref:Aminodeoxychorismate lyase n=1 Tax=Sediminicurvatus halobius TaxID=2182432 RepID=A0A2U2N4R3_9GAMM|nr:D-amino-acid transaminase [Spiribacter halobius]PWG63969.1 D-amino acid aminotransferase [Spiribacter halobius]UEX76303.1 D-amino-acid transaminase [Spiribacter halobius]